MNRSAWATAPRERLGRATRHRRLILLTATLAATALGGTPPPEPGSVGDFGDPQRLALEGNQAFTADEIRAGLGGDLHFLLASHPCAPLDEYLRVLRERLTIGYWHCGFREVEVQAALDPKAQIVTAKLEEGPRYRNGDIQVVGAKQIDAQQLVELLQTRKEPGQRAPWRPGDWAQLDKVSVRRVVAKAQAAFADLGFFFPKARVEIAPDQAARRIQLRITIDDEGPRGIVRDLVVRGAHKNSREDILDFLGVKPGMPLDRAWLDEMDRRLWRSGRFLSHEATPEPIEGAEDGLRLRLELREFEGAPRLAEPLSPTQESLLRLRDWLAAFPTRGEDLVVTGGIGRRHLEWVLCTSRGILLRAWAPEADGEPGFDYGLLFTHNAVSFFSLGERPECLVGSHEAALCVQILVAPDRDAKDDERPFLFKVGAGFATLAAHGPPQPVGLVLDLAPVAFIGLTRRDSLTFSSEQGILTMASGDVRMRVEEETGRLLEAVGSPAAGAQPFRVSFRKGRLDELLGRFEGAPGLRRTEVPAREVWMAMAQRVTASLLDFPRGTPAQRRRVAALCGLLAKHVAGAAAEAGGAMFRDVTRGERFRLPTDERQPTAGFVAQAIAEVLVPGVTRAFPYRSWPCTLVREAALVLRGQGRYTTRELARLYQSGDMGPLGYLACARLLTPVNRPLSQQFAAEGLRKLAPEDFRKDYRLFLEGQGPLADTTVRLVDTFTGLADEDVEAVVAVLGPRVGEPFRDAVGRLKALRKDKPHAEALAAVLDTWWEQALRPWVAEALRRLAPPPTEGPEL